jgi:carbamoyl-phosphate synthase large subunit
MNRRSTVMVTGVGGGGIGEQIMKALRCSDIQYEIVGGDMSPDSFGLMNVDYPYLLPPASDDQYITTVLAIVKKHGVRAVYPGSEPELKVFSKKRTLFSDEGVFLPINPETVIDTCLDKSKTMKFLSEHDIAFPQSVDISSIRDLERISFLPAVLKPSVGGGGSANVMLAQTKSELRMFGEYLLSIYPQFMIQEYVGTPEDEYTVGVLVSMDGELLNSIAIRRNILSGLSNRTKVPNRSGRMELGKTLALSSGISQGEVVRIPEVTTPCERLALVLGCRGAVNIQCRFVAGRIVVFEINPRFSGTTSLRALVGYNEPDVLFRKHCMGETILPRFQYQTGFVARGVVEKVIDRSRVSLGKDLL